MSVRAAKSSPQPTSSWRKWARLGAEVLRRIGPRRLAILALVLGLLVAAYARFVEPRRLEVTHTRIVSPRLPRAMGQVRIAHLSDIHWRENRDGVLVARMVELTNQQLPDLIVLTGDLVNARHTGSLDPFGRLLGRLTAPLGVLAVLGGHDEEAGAEQVVALLEENGIRVLRDEAVPLRIGRTVVWLLGLRDNSEKYVSPAELVQSLPPGARYILLAHSPDVALEADALKAGLVLSGHTHGGQLCLPLLGPLVVPSRFGRKFASGLVWQHETPVYVSRGLGTTVLRARLLCRPEVAILDVQGTANER